MIVNRQTAHQASAEQTNTLVCRPWQGVWVCNVVSVVGECVQPADQQNEFRHALWEQKTVILCTHTQTHTLESHTFCVASISKNWHLKAKYIYINLPIVVNRI